jgi:hypothetical protein
MSAEDYKQQASLIYDRMIESLRFCATAQADYGKWLINTLWLMHSGAIVGLLFRSGGGRPDYLGSLWWFVFGIAFAFAAGFAAWWNFTFAVQQYEKWANPGVLSDPANWPKLDLTMSLKIRLSMWVAIGFGVLSLACLIGGATFVYCNWHTTR